MITALDSSVFWAIIKKEPGYIPWVEVLLKAASEGPLIISPVAFAIFLIGAVFGQLPRPEQSSNR